MTSFRAFVLPVALSHTRAQLASKFMAGGLAGCTAIMSTYPLDLCRTRLICSGMLRSACAPLAAQPRGVVLGGGAGESSLVSAMRGVVRSDGFFGLYRGAGIACAEKFPNLVRAPGSRGTATHTCHTPALPNRTALTPCAGHQLCGL